MGLFADCAAIALKSPIVIARRMLVFAKGDRRSASEARLAVREKTRLFASSVTSLARGKSTGSVVKAYREKVEANVRRLRS